MLATKSSAEISAISEKISNYFETILLEKDQQSGKEINLLKKVFSQGDLLFCETIFGTTSSSALKNAIVSVASVQQYKITPDIVLYIFLSRNKPHTYIALEIHVKLAEPVLKIVTADKKTHKQVQQFIIDTVMQYVCIQSIQA